RSALFGRRLAAVMAHALEAWHAAEPDAARAPLVERRREIFGHEDDGDRAADLLVVLRSRARRDQRQHGTALGRRDRHPALARLDADVVGELEPQLIDEEADAALLVADEDLHRVQAQVREGTFQSGLVAQA